MNDHHFSYPRVVPLQGMTISGHATQRPAPVVPPLPQPPYLRDLQRVGREALARAVQPSKR